jgi:ribosomal-protein-serine acetyltransferase
MFVRKVAPNIEMRQFEVRDAEVVFTVADRNREYLRQWLPWVDQTYSAAQVKDFIIRTLAQYHANQGPNTGIWVGGQLAGSVGCHHIDWANRSCSLGYWLDSACQGQGVITRCCASMIDYLFGDLRLHRVVIQCGTGNTKSCAIPQRLGFTREGVLREAEWVNDRWIDLVVWSMLMEEWKR